LDDLMMNDAHAYRGFFIAAELDLEGKPTGSFLVINSRGMVIQVKTSFLEATGWIDAYMEKQEEEARKQRDLSRERGGR
jgi:hypothetical protein